MATLRLEYNPSILQFSGTLFVTQEIYFTRISIYELISLNKDFLSVEKFFKQVVKYTEIQKIYCFFLSLRRPKIIECFGNQKTLSHNLLSKLHRYTAPFCKTLAKISLTWPAIFTVLSPRRTQRRKKQKQLWIIMNIILCNVWVQQ